VNIRVADKGLTGDFSVGLDSNTVRGNLKSPDLLGEEGAAAAAVSADLFIDAKKFDLVTALVPDITELDAAVDAHFKVRGDLEQPKIGGKGTVLVNHILIPSAGVEFDAVKLNIIPENNGININGKLNSPDGFMDINGRVVLDAKQSWPVHCTVKSKNFRLLNSPKMKVYLDSDLLLQKKEDLFALTGELTIPKADVWLQDLPKGTATVSPDVVILQQPEKEEPASPVEMQLKVTLGNNVHFVGMGLNSFIDGQLTLTAEPGEQLFGSGEFHLKQGTFRAYSQDLDIQTGVISFPGGPLSQPGINLRATRTIGEVTVGVSAIGPAAKPRLTTFSNPPMSESNTISYLLTGSAPSNSTSGAKLSVGRQINNRLSVSVGTDIKTGEKEFITRYRINRKIQVQTTSATSSNAADIFYTIEFDGEDSEAPEE
jgi:translocation and assembly module TamB